MNWLTPVANLLERVALVTLGMATGLLTAAMILIWKGHGC